MSHIRCKSKHFHIIIYTLAVYEYCTSNFSIKYKSRTTRKEVLAITTINIIICHRSYRAHAAVSIIALGQFLSETNFSMNESLADRDMAFCILYCAL